MKRLAALAPPSALLSLAALALIVAGLWVLLGLGAGLLTAGVACFVLEWRVTA